MERATTHETCAGHFVTYIATDLAVGERSPTPTDFGVHVITLTK